MVKNFRHAKTKICFGYDPESNLIEFVEDLKNPGGS